MSIPESMTRSVPLWGFLLTVFLSITGFAAATGAAAYRLDELEAKFRSLDSVKEDVRELKTDVKWIRENLR